MANKDIRTHVDYDFDVRKLLTLPNELFVATLREMNIPVVETDSEILVGLN